MQARLSPAGIHTANEHQMVLDPSMSEKSTRLSIVANTDVTCLLVYLLIWGSPPVLNSIGISGNITLKFRMKQFLQKTSEHSRNESSMEERLEEKNQGGVGCNVN